MVQHALGINYAAVLQLESTLKAAGWIAGKRIGLKYHSWEASKPASQPARQASKLAILQASKLATNQAPNQPRDKSAGKKRSPSRTRRYGTCLCRIGLAEMDALIQCLKFSRVPTEL